MADLSINTIKCLAKVSLILIGTVTALLTAAKLATLYSATLTSFRSIWVAAQLIIFIVWKLSNNMRQEEIEEQVPVEDNVDIIPAVVDNSLAVIATIAPSVAPLSPSPPPTKVVDEEIKIKPKAVTIGRLSSVEEHDSIDATWKAILDGGASSVRQKLRKSDTWEGQTTVEALARQLPVASRPELRKSATFREKTGLERSKGRDREMIVPPTSMVGRPEMQKSATFKEADASAVGWRGREELVMGRDELFGRVEEFIKMHHDHLRLQRQESVEQRRFTGLVSPAY